MTPQWDRPFKINQLTLTLWEDSTSVHCLFLNKDIFSSSSSSCWHASMFPFFIMCTSIIFSTQLSHASICTSITLYLHKTCCASIINVSLMSKKHPPQYNLLHVFFDSELSNAKLSPYQIGCANGNKVWLVKIPFLFSAWELVQIKPANWNETTRAGILLHHASPMVAFRFMRFNKPWDGITL